MSEPADGVLLLHNSVYPSAPDAHESVRAFGRFLSHPVFPVNAAMGYPPGLDRLRFAAIALHYTMFYAEFEALSDRFRAHLADSGAAFKIALFQDEQAYTPERVDFCAEYGIDCVYSCIEQPHAERLYGPAGVRRVINYLPGYVSDYLRRTGERLATPDARRPIDIGYRGRRPTPGWGGAAVEKYEIAIEFERRAAGLDLVLDIETDESKRIYGRAWPRFIARCKGMLGTESGARITSPHDGSEIPYRTLGPRHLEAAAMRSAQILFEGAYSGVLEPDVHYIPLRKDFSNFDEVVARFRDADLRRELTDRAHADLIASGRFGYERFMSGVAAELAAAGVEAIHDPGAAKAVAATLYPSKLSRRVRSYAWGLRARARVARTRLRR